MIYYLILTAFTVSVDSFLCSFSLSYTKGKKIYMVLLITLTVFIMCLLTNYCVLFFSNRINEKTASLGGIILVLIGIFNLIKKEENTYKYNTLIKQSLLTGFAVGLDGACANLSLSLMGINKFYVPLTIAVMHGIMISLGIIFSKTKIGKCFGKTNFIPPLILIALGLYKICSIFL